MDRLAGLIRDDLLLLGKSLGQEPFAAARGRVIVTDAMQYLVVFLLHRKLQLGDLRLHTLDLVVCRGQRGTEFGELPLQVVELLVVIV